MVSWQPINLFTLILAALQGSFVCHVCHCLAVGGPQNKNFRSDAKAVITTVESSSTSTSTSTGKVSLPRRRQFLEVFAGMTLMSSCTWASNPKAALARYVLDDETGDYVEVEDTDWQAAWKQRLDKASTMSTDEIFQAARGAGNVDLRAGPESDASKKRRAMSACRDAAARKKANAGTEKDCTARVFAGEVEFMLDNV